MINNDGDVKPCTFFPNKLGRNINETPMEDIFNKNKDILLKKDIQSKVIGICSSCKFNKICKGCRANAIVFTGNFLNSDPLCWFCNDTENLKRKIITH